MLTEDLLSQYNYDAFVPEKYTRWMNFEPAPRSAKLRQIFLYGTWMGARLG